MMFRRLRDALVLNLAAAYGYHLAVAGIRLWLSRRGLGRQPDCLDRLEVLLPPRRGECQY